MDISGVAQSMVVGSDLDVSLSDIVLEVERVDAGLSAEVNASIIEPLDFSSIGFRRIVSERKAVRSFDQSNFLYGLFKFASSPYESYAMKRKHNKSVYGSTIRRTDNGMFLNRLTEIEVLDVGKRLREVGELLWKRSVDTGVCTSLDLHLADLVGKMASIRHTMYQRHSDCLELSGVFPDSKAFFVENGDKASQVVKRIDEHANWMENQLRGMDIIVSRQADLFSDAELEAVTDMLISQTKTILFS